MSDNMSDTPQSTLSEDYQRGHVDGEAVGEPKGYTKGFADGIAAARKYLNAMPTVPTLPTIRERIVKLKPAPPETLLEMLNFSSKTYNCLAREGIRTIGDLVQWSDVELLLIRLFGYKSLIEVEDRLGWLDYSLAPYQPDSNQS